ncbi:DNA-directed DNA polymerase [Agrilactobacillus composti DSM 18527 = JCM 14202]|uniref:DNA-directed DNA polymerase n=1 Tax=Agrilactobacillus composti DSM 18527 = JCM 14202 TaxID=1423734 RepID=A0A0R1XJQ7_9LACO|nr:Y-family DNA polymerase [Agrilactobacillus composti]KRM30399.1 DNA-directed DNA polymerase [Agrilactobacillus composti DSM 18527 = JCM 14202]
MPNTERTPLSDPRALPRRDMLCIDCKSFYASTEAVKHGMNPLGANIAVLSREESQGGLILAASPYSKSHYHVGLGTRKYEIRPDMNLEFVEPHMADYIHKNLEINHIYRQFTDDIHWFPYSIDESFLDVSGSHRLFGSNWDIASAIQQKVLDQTGIVTTVGMGPNMLLAKLALDNAAKEAAPWKAYWDYDQVADTVWQIPKLDAMWGIGSRYAKRLKALGIYSVYDLAHADVNLLKKRFGVMGEQLYYHAWGIDYANLERRYLVRSENKGYGNSQVLMRDYVTLGDCLTVLKETAAQVATRLRQHHVQTSVVGIGIGYANEGNKHFSAQMKLSPTNLTNELQAAVAYLFQKKWNGTPIRNVGVRCSRISKQLGLQLNLFQDQQKTVNRANLDQIIDKIQVRFGYKALMRASSLTQGGTAISRSSLVGGHQA